MLIPENRAATSILALLCLLSIGGCDGFKDDRPLYQRLSTPEAPVLTPAQALASFEIAPGFQIELVASEPMVEDPVAMAWDARGRLFVVEMRGFMPNMDGTGEDRPVGRVVLLEDRNDDGTMDTSTVFADNLVLPRAIAVTNDGLLIGEPPNLWLCPDITRKSKCENRIRLGEYAADYQTSNMEHLENGLMPGLDNWLYNTMSGRRIRLSKGKLEIENTLRRGQWGIDKDDDGRLYYNSNSNFLSGDYFSANPAVNVSILNAAGLQEEIEKANEVFSIRVNPGVNRAYIDGVLRADGRLKNPTSVSGLAVYRGHQFPEVNRQDIFVPEPAANVVAQLRSNRSSSDFVISAAHITYPDQKWGKKEFLASTDERFRPVDAKVGPDGALYIIDMYRGVIQHSAFLTDELRQQIIERGLDKPIGQGRIWRITSLQNEKQPPVNVETATPSERVQLLKHPNGWVRDTAQRLLLGTDDDHAALRGLILAGKEERADEIAAVHAIWVLAGRSALDSGLVLDAAQLAPRIAKHALQAGGHLLSAAQFLMLREQLTTLPTALRQQMLFSLNTVNSNPAIQNWMLELYRGASKEQYIRPALLLATRNVEKEILSLVLSDETLADSTSNRALLSGLSQGYYRWLRHARADGNANPLLDLIAAQHAGKEWIEMAMLSGLARVATESDFTPWELASPPALFNDQAIAGDSPVWAARLSARRAFTWPGDELAAGLTPLTPKQQALEKLGADFYTHCAACHGMEGEGTPGLAPELAQSQWVTGPVEWLGRIILDGIQGPIQVNDREWNGVMPGHRHISGMNQNTLQGLITYLRRSWGNRAALPTKDQISALFDYTAPNQPWTSVGLQSVPYITGLEKFVGKYKLSFVTFTVSIKDGNLNFEIPMYGSFMLKKVDATTFVTESDDSMTVRFEVDASDRATRFILVRGDGENIVERID